MYRAPRSSQFSLKILKFRYERAFGDRPLEKGGKNPAQHLFRFFVLGVFFAMLAEFIQFQAGLKNFFILMRMMRHALATRAF